VRESVKPKFYLFDTGVVRTLANRIRTPLSDLEKGSLLETFLLHELRAAASYLNLGGEFTYWRTPAGVEIDFIWTRGDVSVGIEIKSSTTWQRKHSSPLHRALEEKMLSKALGCIWGRAICGKDVCGYIVPMLF